MNKELTKLLEQRQKIQSRINKMVSNCKHKIVERKITEDCSSADCSECDKDFGWWCPESPDHVCHYYTHETNEEIITPKGQKSPRFVIVLLDGTHIPYETNDEKRKWETSDSCLFCGQPDERK